MARRGCLDDGAAIRLCFHIRIKKAKKKKLSTPLKSCPKAGRVTSRQRNSQWQIAFVALRSMPLRSGLATRNDLEMSQALENACKNPGKARERRERFGNFTKMRSLRAWHGKVIWERRTRGERRCPSLVHEPPTEPPKLSRTSPQISLACLQGSCKMDVARLGKAIEPYPLETPFSHENVKNILSSFIDRSAVWRPTRLAKRKRTGNIRWRGFMTWRWWLIYLTRVSNGVFRGGSCHTHLPSSLLVLPVIEKTLGY
jgi:hypothetical protein